MSIRFESHMPHGLMVPYPRAPGQRHHTRFFTIPAAEPGKGPGVLELPELDSTTIARLRHHYERRPMDMTQPDGEHHEIGLLKITIIDDNEAA